MSYSIVRNKRRPYAYLFWTFFQALQPYQRLHKGHLGGYSLHRTGVFNALHLFFLPNFPGPTFIPCPTSIPDSRVRDIWNQEKVILILQIIEFTIKKVVSHVTIWQNWCFVQLIIKEMDFSKLLIHFLVKFLHIAIRLKFLQRTVDIGFT